MQGLVKKIGTLVIAIVLFSICINVKAYIICNDGKESKTCMDCHQGCCAGHGGCLDKKSTNNEDYLKYVAIGAGASGVAAAAYSGYKYGSSKNKKK